MTEQGVKYLVTGSAGYLGALLFDCLEELAPRRVVGIDRRASRTTTLAYDLAQGMPQNLPQAEMIFHLAGLFEKDFERRDRIPGSAYSRDNVRATRSLLRIANTHPSHLVFSSTLLLSEEPRPNDPYTRTKGQAERLLLRHRGCPTAVCRLPRVIGLGNGGARPRSSTEGDRRRLPLDLVSAFVGQAVSKQRIEYSGGRLRRWYIHAEEAVECLRACMDLRGVVDGRLYEPITIGEVARLVAGAATRQGLRVRLRRLGGGPPDRAVPERICSLRGRIPKLVSDSKELIDFVATQYLIALAGNGDDPARSTIAHS